MKPITKKSASSKSAGDHFEKIFTEFGSAIAEVFNDPKLKKQVKSLGKNTAGSAKTLGKRFQDKDVQARFRNAGQAAKQFGKSLAEFWNKKQ